MSELCCRRVFEPGLLLEQPGSHRARGRRASARSSAAVVGVFTVIRGQSFAGEALGDIGATGGSGAFLVGIGAALGLPDRGRRRRRGDGADRRSSAPAAGTSRPGSCSAPRSASPHCCSISTPPRQHDRRDRDDPVRLCSSRLRPRRSRWRWCSRGRPGRPGAVLYRPLLLASVSPELAAARGMPVRLVGAAVPARAGGRGGAQCGHDRRDPLHRAAGRPGRDRAAAHTRPGRAIAGGGADRRRRDLARDRARVRQLRLAASEHGWPVSFFVVSLILLVLSARPASQACLRDADPEQGDHDHLAVQSETSAEDVSAASWSTPGSSRLSSRWSPGIVGFFVVMRGSAFVAHAIPNGSFAGAAGAALIGVNTLIGLGVFSLLGRSGSDCSGGAAATTSRPRSCSCSCSGSARCSSA